jgi:hypothetical protein
MQSENKSCTEDPKRMLYRDKAGNVAAAYLCVVDPVHQVDGESALHPRLGLRYPGLLPLPREVSQLKRNRVKKV